MILSGKHCRAVYSLTYFLKTLSAPGEAAFGQQDEKEWCQIDDISKTRSIGIAMLLIQYAQFDVLKL